MKNTSDKLLNILNENIPDMNLKEIEDDSEHKSSQNEDNEEEEVLPLDFRTAMI